MQINLWYKNQRKEILLMEKIFVVIKNGDVDVIRATSKVQAVIINLDSYTDPAKQEDMEDFVESAKVKQKYPHKLNIEDL